MWTCGAHIQDTQQYLSVAVEEPYREGMHRLANFAIMLLLCSLDERLHGAENVVAALLASAPDNLNIQSRMHVQDGFYQLDVSWKHGVVARVQTAKMLATDPEVCAAVAHAVMEITDSPSAWIESEAFSSMPVVLLGSTAN